MRYYLGQCNYKWSHAHNAMEKLWVRREIGKELFENIETNNWQWVLIRIKSTSLPGDVYCTTLIQVESNNDELDTLFLLKYPQAKFLEKTP